jgi:hypothetical protein
MDSREKYLKSIDEHLADVQAVRQAAKDQEAKAIEQGDIRTAMTAAEQVRQCEARTDILLSTRLDVTRGGAVPESTP